MNKNTILIFCLLFILPMFIWSGINKIKNFDKKVGVLGKKLPLSKPILDIGMICVIILEILGALILLYSAIFPKYTSKLLVNMTLILFILFLIVVTAIYHPPTKKIIPFLSNLVVIGSFILLLYVFNL